MEQIDALVEDIAEVLNKLPETNWHPKLEIWASPNVACLMQFLDRLEYSPGTEYEDRHLGKGVSLYCGNFDGNESMPVYIDIEGKSDSLRFAFC